MHTVPAVSKTGTAGTGFVAGGPENIISGL